jgi:hypothetical protein
MFFKNLKLRPKLLVAGLLLTSVPLIIYSWMVLVQNNSSLKVTRDESTKLAWETLDLVVNGIHKVCETQNVIIKIKLTGLLTALREDIRNHGGLKLSEETVDWRVRNQYFLNKSDSVALPKVMIGNQWFGKIVDARKAVLGVDQIKALDAEVDCTIFQRMNDAGAMLRIATTVKNKDGARAIGTYLPVDGNDGNPNPVVSTLLSGQVYYGVSDEGNGLVNGFYEPLFDGGNNVIGAMYVGVAKKHTKGQKLCS